MSIGMNTSRAVIGLFVNTTQQYAVFNLTKSRVWTLYSMLLFRLLLIVFKDFLNTRNLVLGFLFSLLSNCFFLEKKLALKNGHDFSVSLYTSSLTS